MSTRPPRGGPIASDISAGSNPEIDAVYRDFVKRFGECALDALDWLSDADDEIVALAQSNRIDVVHAVVRCADHDTRMRAFGRLIALRANFGATDSRGDAPLHIAARAEDLMATRILLHLGANPNALDAMGRTPLHWGAAAGRMRLSMALMDAGAWLHVKDHDGKTFIDLADAHFRERIQAILHIKELMAKIDVRMSEMQQRQQVAMGRGEYNLSEGE